MAASTKAKEKGSSKVVDETPETRRLAREAANDELRDAVEALRGEGKKWGEIATELEISTGKAMFLGEQAKVDPKDRIKFTDDDDLAKKVVAAREAGLSWGTIMARAGITEGKARGVYTAATGVDTRGLKVKGGGRPAGSANGSAKPAKKAAGVKSSAAPKPPTGPIKHLSEMSLAELKARLNGKDITVSREGSKPEKIGVKNVTKLAKEEMNFTSADGKQRVVNVNDIKKATR